MVEVSVVTATWCERENIPLLVERIRRSLREFRHEIIVVDDNSPDGTWRVALDYADKVIVNEERLGQTLSLAKGIAASRGEFIVTIDADLENPPELIPRLIEMLDYYDLVVASRSKLPRITEILASKTIGRILGVYDVYSNFKALKSKYKEVIAHVRCGETFGAEFIVNAYKNNLRIGELVYEPPPRRSNPRIGGAIRANARIILATIRLTLCLA